MEDIRSEEEKLFAEWCKEKDYTPFIKDGVVVPESYLTAKYKVLFVLKEVPGESVIDLREHLREGANQYTWNDVSLWQYAIQNINKYFNWKDIKDFPNNDFRIEQLKSIASLNLKKTAGKNTSNSKDIRDYAREDQVFLRRQIAIYKPDIVICGGTPTGSCVRQFGLVEKFNDWELTTNGVMYKIVNPFNKKLGTIIINYSHPNARIDSNMKYYPLVDAVREILKG